ncbi:LuxR C-terminal-related transcriptional regulator [Peterkaempfera sp. SMS 1(5)a]|uniref:helix-turn-helix transcriptional regulator n=1 Tax=Peterkaempfera podocarpi TaxID=3232308 RepID=UPI00366D8A37
MTDAATAARVAPALLAREGELEELGALLAQACLVTLTGPAGVGKSRLAEALTADCRWQACATADLLEAQDAASAEEILHRTAARLQEADGPGLLVLDNCDLVLGLVARFASRLLASRRELRIVATSREYLGASRETVYPVRPLAPADAAAFFAVRAGAHHAGVVPEISPEVRAVCARLDGLPLALELAAAHTTVLTSVQILERLDDAMRLLVGGLRTGPAHHRSMRGALDWGAQTLTGQERVLLRRVSVFADAFTLESVEQVCSGAGLPEEEVLEALVGLVAKSLVVCDPSGEQARYRLLHTVRQYGKDLLVQSGERDLLQQARVRHAVRRPGDLRPGDLTEALQWCIDHDAITDGLQLAAAAAPFWLLSGRIREGAGLVTAQLAGADAARGGWQDSPAYTRVVLARGMFDCVLGRAEAALETALRTAARCAQDGDTPGRLWAEVLAGAAELHTDPGSGAHRLARAAVNLPGSSPWTAVATALHALAAVEAGRPDEAKEAAARAVAEARSGALTPAVVAALLAAGTVARTQGRFDAARSALDEAQALAAAAAAKGAQVLILTESGRLALDQASDGDEPGRSRLEQAVALATETGSPLLLAAALDVAGRTRLRQGQGQEARRAFAQVTALSQETVPAQAAAGILGLGEVALATGSASAAWTLIEEAHAIARAGTGPALLAGTLQAVGDCARALGDASRAWSTYHQALGARVNAGLCVAAVESLESLAGLALEQDRLEYGVRLLGAAEGLRGAWGSRRSGPAQDRLEAERGDAVAALSPERFTELYTEGTRLSLQEAVAYAGRQRGPRQRGVGWVSLTPAERQVADLAAAGLSNREIGDRLFSSPRTVQAHLSHVFAKLGINSRKELAAQTQARHRQLPPRRPQADE